MKKKLTCLLLAMAMVFSLTACGSGGDSSGGESAEGQTYEWTASSGLAVGSSWDLGLLKFAELLNERSNGAITLTVHSGATLGSAKETLAGVQMGSIDFIVESSASLSNFTDAMSVFDLPYLFPDAATARKALSGEAAQGQLDALESIGMKGINYWENGIYAIGAVKPVKNLADLKGMRVRSIDSPLQADVYSALGAMPVVLAWGDIYTSIQTGVADAVSSTAVTNMYTQNFYEVAPYITLSNHGYSPAPLICSKSLWDSLSEDIQQLVMECAEEAREYHYQICDEQLAEYMAEMEANGAEFIEIDQTEWEAAVQPVYEKYVGEGGIDPVLVEAIQTDVEAVE